MPSSADKKPAKQAKITFEDAYTRLEEIVEALENSQLPLEDSVKLFKEGAQLYKVCKTRLADLEIVVKQLAEELGEAEPASDQPDGE